MIVRVSQSAARVHSHYAARNTRAGTSRAARQAAGKNILMASAVYGDHVGRRAVQIQRATTRNGQEGSCAAGRHIERAAVVDCRRGFRTEYIFESSTGDQRADGKATGGNQLRAAT